LDALARCMAERCDVRYGWQAVKIRPAERVVEFAGGAEVRYQRLVSTLPLHRTLEMCGLAPDAAPEERCSGGLRPSPAAPLAPDPYTSVLVLNLGAVRGPRRPDVHWLYIPHTRAGFHRVGFYSNVDKGFLPRTDRDTNRKVSLYVERAFPGGRRPSEAETAAYAASVVAELQEWGFIGAAEVVHPTWIEVAYTWTRPGSRWRESAMARLESCGIFAVGRFARWVFQGIADSLRDGFTAGAMLREARS
jgi:protoporphyrinogen oxidase